jgi:uncharacterized protein (DUF697 family)
VRLRRALRVLPPADARVLLTALVATLTGMGCGAASVILAFTWAAEGGRGGWLTAAHWANRVTYACLAVVWACAGVLWLRKRRRSA